MDKTKGHENGGNDQLTNRQNLRVKGESDRPQLDKFKEAARQLETDDDEVRFDEWLKKLVKQESKDDKTPSEDN